MFHRGTSSWMFESKLHGVIFWPNQLFFISLKSCQNINVKNDVEFSIWSCELKVMMKRRVGVKFSLFLGEIAPQGNLTSNLFLVITFSLCPQIENSISFYISTFWELSNSTNKILPNVILIQTFGNLFPKGT
jgi:hypothetical protein